MMLRASCLRRCTAAAPVPTTPAAFFESLKTAAPRASSFMNRPGPVAWFGIDPTAAGPEASAADVIRKTMTTTMVKTSNDFYSDMVWHEEGTVLHGKPPLEAPPLTVPLTPVVDMGIMRAVANPSAPPTYGGSLYGPIQGSGACLVEKGYIPMMIGGTLDDTLPFIEGIHNAAPSEIKVLVNFSADTAMGYDMAAHKVALEKQLVKGVVQFGTRGVNAMARAVRKEHQVRYVDAHALHSKGIFAAKDIRNDYPIFLSIDASILDIAACPGAMGVRVSSSSTSKPSYVPEPAGLTTRDLVHLISIIRGSRIVGISITGFDPTMDIHTKPGTPERGVGALALGKIAKECILKAYSISTKTAAEGMANISEWRKQGQHPEKYPDF